MVNFFKSLAQSPVIKMLRWIRGIIVDRYAVKCYSQEGEDMILRRIFDCKTDGFYVDVGAHHPRRFSNTFYFYKQGWSGINIEPNPNALQAFRLDRPKDINLQIGISDTASVLKYYCFDEPALNTFDESVVKLRLADTPYKIVKTEDIVVDRLDNVLKAHLPLETEIDFLSIDVEGFDFAVLRSNDWHLFRPKFVLAEALNMTLEEAIRCDIALFMIEQSYVLFSKTYNTLIFRDKMI